MNEEKIEVIEVWSGEPSGSNFVTGTLAFRMAGGKILYVAEGFAVEKFLARSDDPNFK